MLDKEVLWKTVDEEVEKILAAHHLPTNPADLIDRKFRFRGFKTIDRYMPKTALDCTWGKILGCRAEDVWPGVAEDLFLEDYRPLYVNLAITTYCVDDDNSPRYIQLTLTECGILIGDGVILDGVLELI